MIKKRKKIFARALALLGVVVVLVSALIIPASAAWTVQDIPFYNYVDLTAFPAPSKNDGRYAYITAVDTKEGTLTINVPFSVADYYFIPYQYTNTTFRALLPEAKVGETYVLNGEYLEETEETASSYMHCVCLFSDAWTDALYWYFGDTLTVTEDILNSYVVPWGANYQTGAPCPAVGETLTRTLRLWVNKDKSYAFEPHDILGDLVSKEIENAYKDGYTNGTNDGYNTGYSKGHDIGYDKGYKDFVTDNLLVSANTMSVRRVYRDVAAENILYGDLFQISELIGYYPFNGYSFRTSLISEDLFGDEYAGSTPVGYEITCITKQLGEYFTVSDSPLTLYGEDVKVTVRLRTTDMLVGQYKEKEYYLEKDNIVTVDWENDFNLLLEDQIQSIMFYVRHPLPLLSTAKFTDFYFAFANTDSHSYQVGLQDGVSMGEAKGHAIGFEEGVSEGYAVGYDDGCLKGKEIGIEEGKKVGYNEGYTNGNNAGYEQGKNVGYYQGVSAEQENGSFFKLIYAVIDAPVSVISKTLNFDVLGVNIASLAASLVTLACLILVVKRLV